MKTQTTSRWLIRLAVLIMITAAASADYDQADSPEFALDLLSVATGVSAAWADSPDFGVDLLSVAVGVSADWEDSPNIDVDLWPVHRGWGDSGEFGAESEGACGLTGIVIEVDGQGQMLGPLPNVAIAVQAHQTTTSGSGQFSFSNLDPGQMVIAVDKPGYYSVDRELEIVESQSRHETFQLVAESGGSTPGAFEFHSPEGNHLVEGMLSDVSFEVTVAWNGSAGSVNYIVDGDTHPASVADLGDGLGRATLTLPAPSGLSTCSEVTIEIVNGEGQSNWINTGVHVSPIPGIVIPWYQDNIPWTPKELTLEYSYEDSYEWDLSLPGEALELKASIGFGAGLSYDLLSAAFSGSLEGAGGLAFSSDLPHSPFEASGEAEMEVSGSLDISFAGCGPSVIAPAWEASYTGEAGVGAPVVAIIELVFPPAAPAIHTLLATPIVKDVVGALKMHLYVLGGASISGKYVAGEWNDDCFLGAEAINVSGTMGLKVQSSLELWGAEAGVYAGGSGTPSFEVCPDWQFQNLILQAYVGVFANAWLFEYSHEVGAEVCFGDCPRGRGIGGMLVDKPAFNGEWRPIGDRGLRWGETNRLARSRPKRLRGSDSLEKSGRAIEEVLVENIAQLAVPSVVADPIETHITYALHDPGKPWHQATDIASVRSVGGAPWTMERVADDLVADYDPHLARVGANLDMAVWNQVNGDVSGATDPGDVAPYMEIAVSWFNRVTEEWSTPLLLADNDVVDRSPRPVRFANATGVVWIRNEGDASPGHATSGDRLMLARNLTGTNVPGDLDSNGVVDLDDYALLAGALGGPEEVPGDPVADLDGDHDCDLADFALFTNLEATGWGIPQVLWAGPKGILSFSFAEDAAGEGHIVFAVDEDGDLETTDDRELYGIETLGGAWQSAALLTTNGLSDTLPVLVAPDGEVICVWSSAGTVLYTRLSDWDPQPIYAEDTLANEAPSLDGITMPGGAAVAYTVQTPDGVDIVAAFYDALLDQWSLPRQLTQDEHAESALSLACDGTQLVMAYLKTQTERNEVDVDIDGVIYRLENVPQPGRTDLCTLRHTLGHDLAVNTESVTFEPANPEPGTSATIRATVENRGELIADGVECAFYDGDPDNGGMLIDSVQIVPGSLIAGSSYDVSVTWDVPTFPMSQEIYVVVDPDLIFDDRDRGNNSTVVQTLLPNITIESASSQQVSSRSVILTARCSNIGVTPTGQFELSWRLGSPDGAEIGRTTVNSVVAAGLRDATLTWDTENQIPGDWVQVYVVADDLASVAEDDEANNVHSLAVLIPEAVPGDLDRDGDVDLADYEIFAGCLEGPPHISAADADRDGDTDVDDFAALQGCLAGPGSSAGGGCANMDLDQDLDVDLADFTMFQHLFTGPRAPLLPTCSRADIDGDDDVDMEDFAALQLGFRGTEAEANRSHQHNGLWYKLQVLPQLHPMGRRGGKANRSVVDFPVTTPVDMRHGASGHHSLYQTCTSNNHNRPDNRVAGGGCPPPALTPPGMPARHRAVSYGV